MMMRTDGSDDGLNTYMDKKKSSMATLIGVRQEWALNLWEVKQLL